MPRAIAANISWERMIRAVERVRERLLRASAALEKAGIPYAVVGGNAVASWVSSVDEAAVRNTQDVDLLLRRSDLDAATAALARACRHSSRRDSSFAATSIRSARRDSRLCRTISSSTSCRVRRRRC